MKYKKGLKIHIMQPLTGRRLRDENGVFLTLHKKIVIV